MSPQFRNKNFYTASMMKLHLASIRNLRPGYTLAPSRPLIGRLPTLSRHVTRSRPLIGREWRVSSRDYAMLLERGAIGNEQESVEYRLYEREDIFQVGSFYLLSAVRFHTVSIAHTDIDVAFAFTWHGAPDTNRARSQECRMHSINSINISKHKWTRGAPKQCVSLNNKHG